ncbi:MAG TPA: L,D-transpeptidase family protein [Ilumatobacteraceae bacterium]|nr:L,D-transpeptidase family protein [Ilumatobacteraceae bacterium]
MRVRVLITPLIGATFLTLAACATTSVTPTALDDSDAASPRTVPLAPVTEVAAVTPTDAPTSTEPAATTTVVEATTTTVAETTTIVAETTTTTTLPPNVVPVPVVADPIVAVGTRSGADTARAQWRLLELGFWVQNADGEYGLTTRQAVMAFQKYYNLETDGVLGEETAQWMTALTERPQARADAGTLVEIDKGKQLLYFVVDGRTEWILNTSTGNGEPYEEPDLNTPGETITGVSITPNGLHKVYRERAEGWWPGDLGEIYRPKYFSGGAAVHGSNSIPDYPASHGCVRISVPAMDWVWEVNMMPMGTPVWVHEGV